MTEQSRDAGQPDRFAVSAGPGFVRPGGRGCPSATVSVRRLVEDVVTEVTGRDARPVTVTIDVPHTLLLGADETLVRGVFRLLLARSVDVTSGRGGRPGEVLVTAVGYPEAVEIEFADSGPDLGAADMVAFSPRSVGRPVFGASAALLAAARLAGAAGGVLTAVTCPDGGAALTVRLPALAAAAVRRAA